VTLTLTFRSLSIPEGQFSKSWQRKAILRGKGDSGLSYSGIDEIPVSHLTELKNAGKSILLDKAIIQIVKLLKTVFCFSWFFFLYIFMSFCVYVPLPPLRGQHTVLCHPRWLPTSGLTEFAVCWWRSWIRTQDY
jgi:hypothetical protein